ncbi:MAG: hypothetical protein JSU00_13765 [Acidobacteria bacterium]|mgnify:CR=1 FL=1|nr:hypothetical protein [Acidobacteriota bacterium]
MPEFKVGDRVPTDKAEVEVTNTQAPLKPGKHQFQLIVTGNDGISSDPVTIDIVVRDRFSISAPAAIAFGQPFTLTAKSASGAQYDNVKFNWTLSS